MKRPYYLLAAALLFSGSALANADDGADTPSKNWPFWRGPNQNGVAVADQHAPTKWSDSESIAWEAPVPGRGHGSPTVVGHRIFLATAEHDENIQSVVCHDRTTGQRLWKTVVHRDGIATKSNKKASQASSTVACDGEHVYITFMSHDAVFATALTIDGEQVWQTRITNYVIHQGFGSSPAIYKSLLLVAADTKVGGVLAGLDRQSGKIVWKNERPKFPNYMSPIVYHVDGKDQLFVSGCELVTSLDPLTGKTNWEIEGATTECVASTVTNGRLIYTSGGYPKNHVAAVNADGSGEIVWEAQDRVYVPSMIVAKDHLFAILDAGVASCRDSNTGKQKWKKRVGGTFTSSLVMVGDHIYATDESGKTTIFKADPEKYELVAQNQLGDEVYSSPAICGGQIFQRIARGDGDQRQEFLVCIE